MKTQRLYSKDADYQKFGVLKTNRNKRYKYNEFFVEGVRNINEAIKSNWTINSFIYSFEKKLSIWATDVIINNKTKINYELTNELINELSGKDDSSELMMIVQMREDSIEQFVLSDNPIFALFDRPSNKGNLGTIIRSCDAFGIEGLIITGHAVDIYDPDTIVASMGSFFKMPVIRMADNNSVTAWICTLKEKYQEFKVIGTSSHSEKAISQCDLNKPVLFMIGNETDGLCNKFKEISDEIAVIPMDLKSSATSFNVACAASIMFYEAVRQRASNK
jgi:tRNA G18 (ribose-2'-O)-methylase SpoU